MTGKATIYEALTKFIDHHVEEIRYRKHGQVERLRQEFETNIQYQVSKHAFGEFLTWYRRTHNITMELADNKYYKSKRPSTV
jgi:hypothetical protein